jgi:hypothetical protein
VRLALHIIQRQFRSTATAQQHHTISQHSTPQQPQLLHLTSRISLTFDNCIQCCVDSCSVLLLDISTDTTCILQTLTQSATDPFRLRAWLIDTPTPTTTTTTTTTKTR